MMNINTLPHGPYDIGPTLNDEQPRDWREWLTVANEAIRTAETATRPKRPMAEAKLRVEALETAQDAIAQAIEMMGYPTLDELARMPV